MVKNIIDNFKNIVTKKYYCFEGRAGRKEFWFFILVSAVVSSVLGAIPKAGPILSLIWTLGLLLPTLGVFARRLHDRGKSGWMILVSVIPLVGAIILLIMCIPEGDKEANAFGEAVQE